MTEYLAAVIPITSLFIYAVLFMIECGAPIFICWPQLLGRDDHDGAAMVRAYMNPVWETTNVFLVFTLISLIAFFPAAVPVWGRALIIPFLISLIVMAARIVGMLYVFYREGKSRAMKALLLVANLLSPAVLFGGTVPYFLTGSLPMGTLDWGLAISIALLAMAATIVLSSLFFNYMRARRSAPWNPRIRRLVLWAYSAFLFLFVIAESFLQFCVPHVFSEGAYDVVVVAGAIIFGILAIFMRSPGKMVAMFAFWLNVLLVGLLFLGTAVAQLPYVIYPSFTIFNSFTDLQTAGILFGILIVGAVIVIPALAWLYSLFAF
jgi:cytochrome d ubiquinol oxidase subunit II